MDESGTYPLRLEAQLDAPLSRWLWLLKWLLLIPHFIVLFLLWVGFVALTVVALFAILITGRYPPFTLADLPDYPARVAVDYPQSLSRGLVLVKWWLLALPHYLVVAVFAGGAWAGWGAVNDDDWSWSSNGGLIELLVFIAAVVLLFTGRYPRQIFDFVIGMNRWVFRVAAYAALMTDRYPPFRLDMGEHEPAPDGNTADVIRPDPAPGLS